MKRMSKVLLTAMAVVLIALAPACRSSRKKVEPPKPVEQPAPAVPAPPAETKIEAPKDFVEEKPVEEVFPSELEELNKYVQERGYVKDAFFAFDESTLDADAQAALTASANWLKSDRGAGYRLLVEGHCDERGTEQYNLALGDRRANIAREYLATLGVDASRIRTVSYGEERPFATGQSESAWAQNRRAHLVLVR